MSICFKQIFLSVAVLGLLAATPVATEAGKGKGNGAGAAGGAVQLRPTGPVSDQYIVLFEDGVSDVRGLANAMARRNGLTLKHTYTSALKGFAAGMPAPVAEALARDPSVAYVEQDLYAHAVEMVTGVARIGADVNVYANMDGTDDPDVVNGQRVDVDVAVIDSGIYPHADLNVYRFYNCIGGCSGSGSAANAIDDNGHGTHVSGTIGALDNGVDLSSGGIAYEVAGVAPGARLWGFKVLDANGGGSFADVIAGIDLVTAHADEIEVANMSLSGIGFLQSLQSAIEASVDAGVVYVVAASNDAADVYGKNGNLDTAATCKGLFCRNADDYIPSAYTAAMTVSALGDFDGVAGGLTSRTLAFTTCTHTGDDVMACFSNYSQSVAAGNPVTSPGAAIDVAGPGMDILSTYPGGYTWINGTSMASPHVAGAVALYIAEYGRATNAAGVHAIRQALIDNAEPQTDWGPADTKDPDSNPEGLVYVGDANAAPGVSITSPTDGTTFDTGAMVGFTGTADDPEDGDLKAVLTWTSDRDGDIGTGESASMALSDGDHLVTASVTDSGGRTGTATITITVGTPNQAPTVSITGPADGTLFDSGATIAFSGTAGDTEDGDLTAGLAWTSDLDGPIGAGGSFSTVLSDGNHLITASVIDSDGSPDSASVNITVGSAPSEVGVVGITFGRTGGRNGTKHLLVTVALEDNLGNPVEGASVSVTLTGPKGGSGTGTTLADGTVTFSLKNAPACDAEDYTMTVTGVTAVGLTWDPNDPANTAAGCP